jgi:hypothetical protein
VELALIFDLLDHAANLVVGIGRVGSGGGGSCFPSIVVVALGEPGVPLICWGAAGTLARSIGARAEKVSVHDFMMSSPLFQVTGLVKYLLKSSLETPPRPRLQR